jgi:hypothetical protein
MRSAIPTRLLFVFLLFSAQFAQAGDDSSPFVTYPVQSRSADELVAVAEKFFAGRARFVAQNGKILISGPREATDSALALFRELDVRAGRYRISLREEGGSEEKRDSLSSAFSVALSGHRAQLAKRSVTLGSGRLEAGGQGTQMVEVMEGGEATLIAGDTAFRVSAKRAGKGRALVSLAQVTGREYGGPTAGLVTELTVPEGQWQPVARSEGSGERKQSGLLSRASQKGRAQRIWELRVELVQP